MFLSAGLQAMLEGKDYGSLYMVTTFVSACLEGGTRVLMRPMLTTVHTLHSDLLYEVYKCF